MIKLYLSNLMEMIFLNIGITGSIACGKSTVSNYLKEKGYTIIDADKLGHIALTSDEVKEKLNPSGYYMLLSMVGIIVMIIWMVSLISQIRLRKAIVKQGKQAEDVLPYTAKTGVVGSYIALISFATIIILQLFADYATGGFVQMSYNLVCPAIGVVMYLVFKIVTKRKFVRLEEMDIHPYKEK